LQPPSELLLLNCRHAIHIGLRNSNDLKFNLLGANLREVAGAMRTPMILSIVRESGWLRRL
jgi:hypothetical protein